ncbi:MAG TPA: universal stress protein [Solirubrobacteraceae bacterium]
MSTSGLYGTVLVAIDGRDGGRDAAALARRLASPEADFQLVYVSAPEFGHSTSLDRADPAGFAHLVEAERALCGPRARVLRTSASSPGDGIDRAADELGADLIVVGSSHRNGISRLFSGDDVKALLHRTARPIAVAPRGYAARPRPISRIGVAVDSRPASEIALRHASALRDEVHGKMVPVSVVEPHYYPSGWTMVAVPYADPEVELASARERLEGIAGPDLQLVYGLPGEELARFSELVDLLVVGSRRNGTLQRLMLGSTSEYLTRHVYAPLLITPAVQAPAHAERQTEAVS